MQQIKAVLLDMYGVVMKQTGDDFVPYIQGIYPQLTREDIEGPWLSADVNGVSSLEVWRTLGFTGDIEMHEKTYLDTLEINEGFCSFAEQVKQNYKLALVSNDASRWSHYLREKYDINKYFDSINISGDLQIKKPDPRIFNRAIEQVGCSPAECLYVDDRGYYLDGAKKLGMNIVLFNSRNEQYEAPTVYSFEELLKLLKQYQDV